MSLNGYSGVGEKVVPLFGLCYLFGIGPAAEPRLMDGIVYRWTEEVKYLLNCPPPPQNMNRVRERKGKDERQRSRRGRLICTLVVHPCRLMYHLNYAQSPSGTSFFFFFILILGQEVQRIIPRTYRSMPNAPVVGGLCSLSAHIRHSHTDSLSLGYLQYYVRIRGLVLKALERASKVMV